MSTNVSVIIPTLNAGRQLYDLLQQLKKQTLRPNEILVVDSESGDNTREIAKAEEARVLIINRKDFDHGGTRDMALRQTTGDVVVFMTQDALPANEFFLENLIAPFEDRQIAAASGRQIARPDARPYEELVRKHNYPEEALTWSSSDIDVLGIRAFRISNACAAYRRDAYLDVGGFDCAILTNEDMLIAEKFLSRGYKIAYSSKASVFHSHNYTWLQEYRRNYIIGRTLKRYEGRFQYVKEMGAGITLVREVLKALIQEGHFAECFFFAMNCSARLLGNRLGRYKEGKLLNDSKR